jgi:hypothetical protein
MSFTPSPTLRKVLDNVKPEELDLMLRQNYKHLFETPEERLKFVNDLLDEIENTTLPYPTIGIQKAIDNIRNQNPLE